MLSSESVSWRQGPVRSSLWTGTAANRGGPLPDRRPAVPAGRDRLPGRHEPDRRALTFVSCGLDSGVRCLRVWTMKDVISWSISRAGPARNQEAESRPPRSPDSGGEDKRSPERDWFPSSIAHHRQAEHPLLPMLLMNQSSATIRAEGRAGVLSLPASCLSDLWKLQPEVLLSFSE